MRANSPNEVEAMRYWRMAMRVGEGGTPMWPQCKEAGVAAITYEPIAFTDLTNYSRTNLPAEWSELSGSRPTSMRSVAFDMEGGDTILVKEGNKIVGRGKITGIPGQRAYQYRPELGLIDENKVPWPHTVPVDWEEDFEPVIATLGTIQIVTVEEISAAEDSKVTHAAPSPNFEANDAFGAVEQLDLMIPQWTGGQHNPFNVGDKPDFYTPEAIREKKDAQTSRSEFFIKYLVGISWIVDGAVPYVFRTRDGKLRSLDAGCLGSLSRRPTPDISFVLAPDRTIIAVEPSSERMRTYEPMRQKILAELGVRNTSPLNAKSVSFLSVTKIREILAGRGFEESETQKILKLAHPQHRKRPFYLKRPEEGNDHVHRSLVMHPALPEIKPALLSINGVIFESAYYHHSNMRDFPKRLHTGGTPREHGIAMDFESESALHDLVNMIFAPAVAGKAIASSNAIDPSVLDDIEAAKTDLDNAETITEKIALVKSRVGQGRFREDLIEFWEGCAVTIVRLPSLLRASHIKPWRRGTNSERLDKYNGLLLTPNLDHAFDAGLISFEDDGRILISESVTEDEAAALGLDRDVKLRRVDPRHFPYLKWHRENEFER